MRVPVYLQFTRNEQVDSFSRENSDSHTEEEVDSALETNLSMIRWTRLRGIARNTYKSVDRFPGERIELYELDWPD